jgi:crotonobetainyl-CoA:carnitine CoA-transferase CaiB-like acyl-CoA transferase
MGRSGPYRNMASHGPSFDAFAGLGQPVGQSISRYEGRQSAPVGMHSVSLHAAAGALAAIMCARRTGQGCLIEVAAAESAAHWLPESADPLLNRDVTHKRPGFTDKSGRMKYWARMENYRTLDDKLIFLQSLTEKSWKALIEVLDRPDLQAIYERSPQTGTEDSEVAGLLSEIFKSRDRADWLAIFRPANVAAIPVNDFEDLVNDPHFRSRPNTYAATLQSGEVLELLGTPIRVEGESFSAPIAPELGQHNSRLREEFGLD